MKYLLHRLRDHFIQLKVRTRVTALVLVAAMITGVLGVALLNLRVTYGSGNDTTQSIPSYSGPQGDVIQNLPYDDSFTDLEQINWAKIVDHDGTMPSKGDYSGEGRQNFGGNEQAYTSILSRQWNGFNTPSHVIMNAADINFYGYGIMPFLDYAWCSDKFYETNASGNAEISFWLEPKQMIFHSFRETGFLFYGKMQNGNYTGYALILQCNNAEGLQETGTATLSLYYINNEQWDINGYDGLGYGDRFTNGNFGAGPADGIYRPGDTNTTRQRLVILKDGILNRSTDPFHISISVSEPGNIFRIRVDGDSASGNMTIPSDPAMRGFGFFMGSWSHNCDILTVIKYSRFIGLKTVPIPTTATVKFVLNGTTTEIRPREYEGFTSDGNKLNQQVSYAGQKYNIAAPPTITNDGKVYQLFTSSRGDVSAGNTLACRYRPNSSENETTLYYITSPSLGSWKKEAQVSGGAWEIGTAQNPIPVLQNDELTYRMTIDQPPVIPMLTSGNNQYSTDVTWFRQPADAPSIEKEHVKTITFVPLSDNYDTPAEFISAHSNEWNGSPIAKCWDGTETDTTLNPDFDTAKVFVWAVRIGTDSYELYIGGQGGVNMTANPASTYQFFNFYTCLTIAGMQYFHTDKAQSMADMFYGLASLTALDVTHFDTSNVTDMSSMFYYCASLTTLDVTHFDTSKVTSMWSMFEECSLLTALDVTHFDTANVIFMGRMFAYCDQLAVLDVSRFNTAKVENIRSMFARCRDLTTLNVSHFNTSKVTDMANMFYYCVSLTTLDVSHFDTAMVTDMSYMFSYCISLTALNVSYFNTAKVYSMDAMFRNCYGLSALDVSHFNTAHVASMKNMFASCYGLSTLEVSRFDTANVTDMSYMFYNCTALITLDVSHFNTAKVTDMNSMFTSCFGLSVLNVSYFNTANVTNMAFMFQSCYNLAVLDVSHFNTAKVTDLKYMFSRCDGLSVLDVSRFNTSNVTDMTDVFGWSRVTTLDVSHFDTANVTAMGAMFYMCGNLTTLDLSHFNTSKVKDLSRFVAGCGKLTQLHMETANFSAVTDTSIMFEASLGTMQIYVGTSTAATFINSAKLSSQTVTIQSASAFVPPTVPTTLTLIPPTPPTSLTLIPPTSPPAFLPPVGGGAAGTVYTVVDLIPAGLTIITASITGARNTVGTIAGHDAVKVSGISYVLSGQRITWTVDKDVSMPFLLYVKTTVTAAGSGGIYHNVAQITLPNGDSAETNDTWHELNTATDRFVTEQYYLFTGTNNPMLEADNYYNGGNPVHKNIGDDFTRTLIDPEPDPTGVYGDHKYHGDPNHPENDPHEDGTTHIGDAHIPAAISGYQYYGYQYIRDVADDPNTGSAGQIHQGQPPIVVYSNIQTSKIIRYFYVAVPLVRIHFVDASGTVLKAVATERAATYGGSYTMPDQHMDSFTVGGTTWHFGNRYTLIDSTGQAVATATAGQPPKPAFNSITKNEDITLYFTQAAPAPVVIVHFLEYKNTANLLYNDTTYALPFDPTTARRNGVALDAVLTKMGKNYTFMGWTHDKPSGSELGNYPRNDASNVNLSTLADLKADLPTITASNAPYHIYLSFAAKYTIIEQFHSNGAGYPNLYDALPGGQIITQKNSGDSFTACENAPAPLPKSIPATLQHGGQTWYYVGYKLNEDFLALNPGYPPSPVFSSLHDDYKLIYVYETRGAYPLVSKDARITDCAHSPAHKTNWENWPNRTDNNATYVGVDDVIEYKITVEINAASSVTVTDLLPAGLAFVSDVPAAGFTRVLKNGDNATIGDRTQVQWASSSNVSAGVYTFTVKVKVLLADRIFVNTATVTLGSRDYTTNPTYHDSHKMPWVLLHIRQIVVGPMPNNLQLPLAGYFELTHDGKKIPLLGDSGLEGWFDTAYADYHLTESGLYTVYDFIPQYYEYLGHKANAGAATTDALAGDHTNGLILPGSTNPKGANGEIELLYDGNNREWWVTVYIKPTTKPKDHEESYASNYFKREIIF